MNPLHRVEITVAGTDDVYAVRSAFAVPPVPGDIIEYGDVQARVVARRIHVGLTGRVTIEAAAPARTGDRWTDEALRHLRFVPVGELDRAGGDVARVIAEEGETA